MNGHFYFLEYLWCNTWNVMETVWLLSFSFHYDCLGFSYLKIAFIMRLLSFVIFIEGRVASVSVFHVSSSCFRYTKNSLKFFALVETFYGHRNKYNFLYTVCTKDYELFKCWNKSETQRSHTHDNNDDKPRTIANAFTEQVWQHCDLRDLHMAVCRRNTHSLTHSLRVESTEN